MNGLWMLQYRFQNEWVGNGVIVFRGGKIYGGDSGYYYVGQYKTSVPHLSGMAKVIRHDPRAMSMFSTLIYDFDIEMQGTCEKSEIGATFEATGEAFVDSTRIPFSVVFRKVQDIE